MKHSGCGISRTGYGRSRTLPARRQFISSFIIKSWGQGLRISGGYVVKDATHTRNLRAQENVI